MTDKVLLYVEDEKAAVFLLEAAIQEADLPVKLFHVSDGEQALAFLHRSGAYAKAPRPDLILLDLNLPRMNGWEVLSEMKTSGDLRSIGVVIFTSSSLPTDRWRSLSLGAKGYITKPSSFEGFIEAVRTACSQIPAR
jgi:CheY-like chemotaxis protein